MIRWTILIGILLALPVAAQDAPSQDDAEVEESTETTDDEEAVDDFELDDNADHTEEDEDVFEASVEVSYQQSVAFPTDI